MLSVETEIGAKTFGDWAYQAIAKHYQKMVKYETGVLADQDPEELHQMRVGARRLRSALASFAPAVILPKSAQEKNVGRAGRLLGTLRDLDVMQAEINTNYVPILSKTEQKRLSQALTILAKERKDALAMVKEFLQAKFYQQLKMGFATWLERPVYQPLATVPIDLILPDLLLPEVSRLLLHEGWFVGLNGIESQAELEGFLERESVPLHDLRKEAKRSRYLLELFTPLYSENYQMYLQEVKEIQTVLGEIQDSFVFASFFENIFGKHLDRDLPSLTQKLRETRWTKWQEWQPLQQKFLQPEFRQSFRLTIQKV